MVVDDEETYFPRGGSSGKITKKRNFVFEKKNQNNDAPKKKLGRRERKRLKLQKLQNTNEDEEDDDDDSKKFDEENQETVVETSSIKKVQPLSYRSLSEGFVTLCSVNTILPRHMKVSLPERLLATIDLRDISTPLRESKFVDLKKVFRVGDIIACKIKSPKKKTSEGNLKATSDPAEINCDLDQNQIHVGSTFLGAVKSHEDHGYTIFSGISGLNVFLPFKNCPAKTESTKEKASLAVGKLVWCTVVKSTEGDGNKNVQVSIKEEDFEKFANLIEGVTEKSLVPGMKFNLTIIQHIKNDLKVSIDDVGTIGFVPHTHFKSIACEASDFKIGTKLKGTLLYKYPISNVPAFSLRVDPTSKVEEVLETGAIFERAEIVSHDQRGLGVKFEHAGKICFGIISKRRMEGDVSCKKLEQLFPKGNHLKVVVIGYHHIDQLYSCSTENELVTGKFLTMTQLKEMVGKLVTVVIKEIKERGAVVMIDNRTAFVQDSQVTDTVSSQPLKKLQVNSKHKGRILRVDPDRNSILVTLRPTLVNNKPLVDFAKATKGDSYYGSVISIGSDKINVGFFNGLKSEITQENLILDVNKYQVGELVKCYVIRDCNKSKYPTFSLVRHVDQMLLSIGQTYKLIVKGITSSGIECLLNEKSNVLNVNIPLRHLCDDSSLRQKVLQTFSLGTTIDGHLFCFDSHLNPVFSLRESVKYFFQKGGEGLRKNGIAAIKLKSLMPVIISEEVNDGFYVSVPIPNHNGKVLVSKQTIQSYENASIGDVVWLSVNNVSLRERKLSLGFPSLGSHEGQLKQWAIADLRSHLAVLSAFVTYKTGDRVSAVATGVGNCCKLPDGKKGLVESQDENKKFSKGQKLDLIVLIEDKETGLPILAEWDNPPQAALEVTRSAKFSTFFVSERFFVGKSSQGSICLCPTRYHPNSTESDVDFEHIVKRNFAVFVTYRDGDILFGAPRSLSLCNPRDYNVDECDNTKNEETKSNEKTRKKKRNRSLSNKPGEREKKAKLTLVTSGTPDKSTHLESSKMSHKKMKRKSVQDASFSPADSESNDESPDHLKSTGSPKKLKKKKKPSLNSTNPLLLNSEY